MAAYRATQGVATPTGDLTAGTPPSQLQALFQQQLAAAAQAGAPVPAAPATGAAPGIIDFSRQFSGKHLKILNQLTGKRYKSGAAATVIEEINEKPPPISKMRPLLRRLGKDIPEPFNNDFFARTVIPAIWRGELSD